MSNDYQREIITFLKGYGAKGVYTVPGGKHPSLRFEFRGQPRRFTIAATPSDHRAVLNTISDLTRMLGPPDEVVPEAESRRLEDMLPEIKDQPRYAGRIALYTSKIAGRDYNRLRFYIPKELVSSLDLLGKWGDISHLAKNTWHIGIIRSSEGHKLQYPTFRREGSSATVIDIRASKVGMSEAAFAVTHADYSVVGGALVVYLPEGELKPVDPRFRPFKPEVKPVAPEPPRVVAVTTPSVASEEANAMNLRGILSAIASVERHTVYRLARLKDEGGGSAWAWRAPVVRLDDGEETEV